MHDATINKKVLLVDDDVITLIAHRLSLEELGFEVDEAKNGQEALNKFTKNISSYELILMDYNLPDTNGGIVAQKIRSMVNPNQQHPLIIGVTAHIEKDIIQKCLSMGMDDVTSKPLLPDKIQTLLHKIALRSPNDQFHNSLNKKGNYEIHQ